MERKGYSIIQCKARNACPKMIATTGELADKIEKLLEAEQIDQYIKSKFGPRVAKHNTIEIVFSGCPNGCSLPQIKDIAIMGRSKLELIKKHCTACQDCMAVCREGALSVVNGQPHLDQDKCIGCNDCLQVCPLGTIVEVSKGYRLLAGGRLGRHPHLAIEIEAFLTAEEVVPAVKKILDFYKKNSRSRERLADMIRRLNVIS